MSNFKKTSAHQKGSISCVKSVRIVFFCSVFSRIQSPAGKYMFKVNNRNTRRRCEICSKLTIKIPEPRHWRRSGIFIVNFEHISHLALVFLLLTLSRKMAAGSECRKIRKRQTPNTDTFHVVTPTSFPIMKLKFIL